MCEGVDWDVAPAWMSGGTLVNTVLQGDPLGKGLELIIINPQ
jgi:hypothetical protein